MDILNQCGGSILNIFKPSNKNHRKGTVVGHLTPVEHNRLTVSETVTLDEYAGGYIEMMEFKNSARGQLTALGNKNALECNLDGFILAMKQKAYGTLASSEL